MTPLSEAKAATKTVVKQYQGGLVDAADKYWDHGLQNKQAIWSGMNAGPQLTYLSSTTGAATFNAANLPTNRI